MSRELGKFFSYGTNHKYAPMSFRESLYLNSEQLRNVLPQIKSHYNLPEIAILSTCNRLEMYGISPEIETHIPEVLPEIFRDLQVLAKKPERNECFRDRTFCHTGKTAIKHVFDVASSVDSLVVGETQITGQFKEAFTLAHKASTMGPHLYHLSQNALRVAKKVRSETVIGRKTVSIGHAAIDLSRKIFANLSEKNLLLLGAGEIAQVTGVYAKKVGIQDISVVNRSLDRALQLTKLLGGGNAGPLSELEHYLRHADIVITALSSEKPIITPAFLKRVLAKRKSRPIYIVDIAIPRNVDPACGRFESVYLFELDDLRHYIDENLSERESAAKEAQQIIEQSLEKFCERVVKFPESRAIAQFNRYIETLLIRESQKTFRRKELQTLDELQIQALQRMLASVSQKLTADFALAMQNAGMENKKHFQELIQEITKNHFISES